MKARRPYGWSSGRATIATAASALAMLVLFACAGSDVDRPIEDEGAPPPPGTGLPPAVVPDAEAPAEDAPTETRRCSKGGFCYEALPARKPLAAVSALAVDDAWAAGSDVIVRWEGTSWREVYRHGGPLDGVRFIDLAVTPTNDVAAMARSDSSFLFVRSSKNDDGSVAFRELVADEPENAPGNRAPFDVSWVTPAADAFWLVEGDRWIDTANRVLRFHESDEGTMVVDDVTPTSDEEDAPTYAWHSVWGFGPDDVYVGGRACGASGCNGPDDHSAIAHYDGTTWSIQLLETADPVRGLFGTTATGQPRQLWLWLAKSQQNGWFVNGSLRLVPVSGSGSLGAATFVHELPVPDYPIRNGTRSCGHSRGVFGSAISPNAAWISNGCFVYRWNGSQLDIVPTAIDDVPPGDVTAVWAGSVDDAWIVGTSVPLLNPNLPPAGFAAQRRAGGDK